MKKSAFTLLFILGALCAQAQVRPFVKMGLSGFPSRLNNMPEIEETLCVKAGGGIDYLLWQPADSSRWSVSLQPEVDYLMHSIDFYAYAFNGTHFSNGRFRHTLHYLNVPVVAVLHRKSKSGRNEWRLKGGLYATVGLTGHASVKYDERYPSLGLGGKRRQSMHGDLFAHRMHYAGGVINDYGEPLVTGKYRRIDVGLTGGAEYAFRHFIVGLEYEYGFTRRIHDLFGKDVRNISYECIFGYRF